MSTDSTELTFVRCPSCRSLVPAISTRCRMCGATLEATATAEGDDQEPRKSGRVRQRTMSESSSEMTSAVGQVRENAVLEPVKPTSSTPAPQATKPQVEQDDDPLSEYIEEDDLMEEEEEEEPISAASIKAPSEPSRTVASLFDEADDDEEEDDLADLDLDDPLAAFTEAPAPVEPPPVARPVAASSAREETESITVSSNDRSRRAIEMDAADSGAEDGADSPSMQAKQRPEQERPRAQTPPPRPQQPEQRPRAEAKPQSAPPQQMRQQPTAPQQSSRPTPPPAQPRQQHQGQHSSNGPGRSGAGAEKPQQAHQAAERRAATPTPPAPAREEGRMQQSSRGDSRPDQSAQQQGSQQRPARMEPPAVQRAQPATASGVGAAPAAFKPGVATAEAQAGRLFGWLVNYTDPNGAAVEIREGKFFISRKSVKPSDLVIDDHTISAPHALLNVSASGGLLVQDLMSERGVHVRRKGSDTYRREEEVVTVTHGDWLRLGDVEFLVSLIAHPGEQ